MLAHPTSHFPRAPPLLSRAMERVKYEDAWQAWLVASEGETELAMPPIPNVTPSVYGTCVSVAEGVEVSLREVVSQAIVATSLCTGNGAKLKSDPAFASVRRALDKTLALAVVTGDVARDGTGLKEALDRGVEMYGPGKIVFGNGKATVFVASGTGVTRDFVKEREVAFSVEKDIVTLGADRLKLAIELASIGPVSIADTENAMGRLEDATTECFARTGGTK